MRRLTVILLALLGIILLALLVLATPILPTLRNVIWSSVIARVGAIAQVGPLTVDNNVSLQLARLRAENIRLAAELTDYQRLRAELTSVSFASLRSIDALIIGRPIEELSSAFILNRGAADGVTLQTPVVINGSQLVCLIDQLTAHTARCRSLHHPAVSVRAHAADERANGIVRGQTYSSVVITTVPRDATLTPLEPIVTMAQGGIPEGLLIGTVETVRLTDQAAYQEATLRLPYDLDTIRGVVILVQP